MLEQQRTDSEETNIRLQGYGKRILWRRRSGFKETKNGFQEDEEEGLGRQRTGDCCVENEGCVTWLCHVCGMTNSCVWSS